MNDTTLYEKLKKAQIAKIEAETEKLKREADAVKSGLRSDFWSETIKILGGVVLGAGGVIVAFNGYEVADAMKKSTESEIKLVKRDHDEIVKAKQTAEKETSTALASLEQVRKDLVEEKRKLDETKASAERYYSIAKSADQVTKQLTYIQFRGGLVRDMINELATDIGKSGFDAPGPERRAGTYSNHIKYYRPKQLQDAQRLAAAIEKFFRSKGCPITMRVDFFEGAVSENPPLEAWLVNDCIRN